MLDHPTQLDRYLRAHIPVTQSMGIRLGEFDDLGIALVAPIELNLNDKGTAFAGSMATIATLCGWALTQITAAGGGHTADVVVIHSEIHYLKPARYDLSARCNAPDSVLVQSFLRRLAQEGRARWNLEIILRSGGTSVLTCSACYQARRVESAGST